MTLAKSERKKKINGILKKKKVILKFKIQIWSREMWSKIWDLNLPTKVTVTLYLKILPNTFSKTLEDIVIINLMMDFLHV